MGLYGHSYTCTAPDSGLRHHIDVHMRVYSGPYYQNLLNLLEHLEILAIERRFLFAFAYYLVATSRYYFFHQSKNADFPDVFHRGVLRHLVLNCLFLDSSKVGSQARRHRNYSGLP